MNSSLPEILSTEIGQLLLPLKDLDSKEEITSFIKKLGWDFDGQVDVNLAPLVSVVEGLIDLLLDLEAAQTDEEKLEALIALVEKIMEVLDELKGQISAINTALDNVQNMVGKLDDLAADLPRRMIDYLLYDYLENYHPSVYGPLYLLEIAKKDIDPDSQQEYRVIQWDQVGNLFTQPIEILNSAYSWSTAFESDKFLKKFEEMLGTFSIAGGIYQQSDTIMANLGRESPDDQEIRIPLYQDGIWGENWKEIDLNISPIPADGNLKAGLLLYPYLLGNADLQSDISEKWSIDLSGGAAIGGGLGLEIRPPYAFNAKTDLFTTPQDSIDFDLSLKIKRKEDQGQVVLIGAPGKSYLGYKNFEGKLFAKKKGSSSNLGVEAKLATLELVIAPGEESDGFLQKIIPDGFRVAFDFGAGYSLKEGFYFSGSGTFEMYFATHITLGPLEIIGLLLSFSPDSEKLKLGLGSALKIELGAFLAVVENIGLETALDFQSDSPNLGVVDLSVGFKPPSRIGLSIETSAVRGGGYLIFEPDKEQYGGALELSIKDSFSVTAIGLVSTIYDTDGSKNYSLLLIVSVQFSPGIALGMGFFLTGLGGMIGIHRTVNVDALREGVKNNAVDHILFPENVLENITEIIANIREIFPPKKDQFLIGLMAKIDYGSPTLITVEFGIIIEFANPWRIAILGVIKMVLPDPKNVILQLQINFVGILDFEQKYMSLDASIYNSRLLTITLEGDMAFRLFWGKEKIFLMSVGGFHPSFKPKQSLKLGSMKRLTASLLSGNPNLSLKAYFAMTSNTVQFGAQIDLLYKKGKFKVVGYFGFDVLFQFSPFWFIASIRAGVSVKKGSKTLLSVKLAFELQGPTPYIAKGKAEFRVLGIKVKAKFNKQWGKSGQIDLPKIPILPKVVEAFQQDRSWTSEVPSDQFLMVSLREIELAEGMILLHSQGKFTIKQDVLPLGMIISKFGNDYPSDVKKVWVDRVDLQGVSATTDPANGSFAPAAFQNLSDAQKLSSPSYTEERSGVEVSDSGGINLNYSINHIVDYEVRVSDFDNDSEEEYGLEQSEKLTDTFQDNDANLFAQMAKSAVQRRSGLARDLENKRTKLEGKTLKIDTEKFAIVDNEDLRIFNNIDLTIGSKAELESELDQLLQHAPELRNSLIIVPESEVLV